jgi:hypothetical protein
VQEVFIHRNVDERGPLKRGCPSRPALGMALRCRESNSGLSARKLVTIMFVEFYLDEMTHLTWNYVTAD